MNAAPVFLERLEFVDHVAWQYPEWMNIALASFKCSANSA